MLDLVATSEAMRFCDRISRRRWLEVGSLGPLALGLPALFRARAEGAIHRDATFGRAKRVILLFMWGGPAHQDTWDLKPDGPSETRGEFLPIATRIPGIHISEHLPLVARHTDKLAIIRSVGQGDNNHLSAAYASLTGRRHPRENQNVVPSADDFPQVGSVLSKLRPGRKDVPTFVALPDQIHTTGGTVVPGQGGGFLGRGYDPFQILDHPDRPDFSISNLRLPLGVDPDRMEDRTGLQRHLDGMARRAEKLTALRTWNAFSQQALNLVVSTKTREALDLGQLSMRDRRRYGFHTFGQSVLLARRLIEVGVPLVTVYWHRERKTIDTTWDTHSRNFEELKTRLMPSVDRPIAMLLEDLAARGMLDETLVVWNSEFGRTPRINTNGGRDHWGACNSVVMAGGGVPGGQIYGKSDSQAAYPVDDKVTQADIAATIYHLMGIDPRTRFVDRLNRPQEVAVGRPLGKLLGGASRPPAMAPPKRRAQVPAMGTFRRMLMQRSNRFLHLDCGNPQSEPEWELVGWSEPTGVRAERYRAIAEQASIVRYLGLFYTHFDYGYLVFRLAEPADMSKVHLALRDQPIPVSHELRDAPPDTLWQIPFPSGMIAQLPFPENKAFDLAIRAPGWKVTDMALVGDPIESWHYPPVSILPSTQESKPQSTS